jgi:hypothetical protein
MAFQTQFKGLIDLAIDSWEVERRAEIREWCREVIKSL